jgi:DMSO/TMAO reductase YedYZ heme-binding membrane subunit
MGPALWYFSRATGLVSLGLFTIVMVLGSLGGGRFERRGWSRLTLSALHRSLALTSVVFIAIHIVSAVVDSYVSLRWIDVVLPFVSSYQPFWVGIGAMAVDLLIAIVATSLLRTRISLRVWRAVHWLAYLCWPVALVHGIGMAQSDSNRGWILTYEVLCVLAVLVAAAARVMATHPDTEARKLSPLQR